MNIDNKQVDRGITFVTISGSDHIKQVVRIGSASKGVPDTWVSLHVRSRNFESFGEDTTQLTDGRLLSDLSGELTLRALPESPLTHYEDGRAICGILRYDSSRYDRPDYSVTLYLSTRELQHVADLARTRKLAAIHVEFKASLATSVPGTADENISGLHSSTFGRLAYYVWDHDKPLAIEVARIEFELDRASGADGPEDGALAKGPRVRHLIARAHRSLARTVVNYPQLKWVGDGVHSTWGFGREDPTPEQIRQISATGAGSMLEALVEETCKQGGYVPYQTASCAVEFIRANGIIYRAREYQTANADKKEAPKSAEPIVVPGLLPMWLAPGIRADQPMDGWISLEALDRDSLIDVCRQFYSSGARCKWFEKMLVEALVGAETYATLKVSKTTPSNWTGQFQFLRSLVASWAFSNSKGGATYQLYMLVGNTAITVGRLGLFAALTWWTYTQYERTPNWKPGLGLIVLALVALGWAGRYMTQLIVRWSRAVPAQAAASLLLSTPFGSALSALLEAYGAVSGETTSITAARDAVRAAIAKGGAIDPIALAFLDRAHECKEIVWMRSGSGRPTELDEVESTPAKSEE